MTIDTICDNDGEEFNITGGTWNAFGRAYSHKHPDHIDKHQLFADLIGEERVTAKTIAYRMSFTNIIILGFMSKDKEIIDLETKVYDLELELAKALEILELLELYGE